VVGEGGLTMSSGGISFGQSGEDGVLTAGDVTMSYLNMCVQTPIQVGGDWDIGTIGLEGHWSVQGYIRDWNIVDGDNTTITQAAWACSDAQWTGTPTISGGRPDWKMTTANNWAGPNIWDLQSYQLYGDVVEIDGNADGAVSVLQSTGGTVDVNSLQIALGNATASKGSYVDLTNCKVYVRGSGTAWNNDSTATTSFDITSGTTVTLDPAGGSMTVFSNSADNGYDVESDWDNNFAFGALEIGQGDTITLSDILYADSLVGLGTGATVNKNGNTVYLMEEATSITFTGSGEVYIFAQNVAPIVEAGANHNVALSTTVSLDATVSDNDGLPDPPGSVTTTWSKYSGPGSVTFGNASAVDTTASFSAAGTYVLRLTADDGSLRRRTTRQFSWWTRRWCRVSAFRSTSASATPIRSSTSTWTRRRTLRAHTSWSTASMLFHAVQRSGRQGVCQDGSGRRRGNYLGPV